MRAPRLRLVSSLAGAGALACIPLEPPAWVITQPVSWGVRVAVVAPGGYASGLDVPAGRARAGALPLDTLEMEWFAPAPSGVRVDPPIWIACHDFACVMNSAAAVEACDEPLPLTLDGPCRLGVGARIRVVLGGLYTYRGSIPPAILTVGSWGGEVDPETCLARLVASPRAGLERCLIGQYDLPFGPTWHIADQLPPEATGIPFDAIPPEVLDDAPDLHPVIEGFEVVRGADEPRFVRDGETVLAQPGDAIIVRLVLAADARQAYHSVFKDPTAPTGYSAKPGEEEIYVVTKFSAEVEGYPELGRQDIEHDFIVPDGGEPLVFHARVADSRDGTAYASLRFEVP